MAVLPMALVGTGVAVSQRKRVMGPRDEAAGELISSWADVRRHLQDLDVPGDGPEVYIGALESICRGSMDFGYIEKRTRGIKAVAVSGERIFRFEVESSGKVSGTTSYVDQIAFVVLQNSRSGLHMEAGSKSDGSWSLEAKQGREALQAFADRLQERIKT